MDNKGEEFLNRLYKDLYKSEDVMHNIDSRYIGNKNENVKKYMDSMDKLHTLVGETNRHIGLLKGLYYRRYVIKEEDIPESYYTHQQEIALERGFGHVELTSEMKKEMAKTVIEDQKKSLDVWIEYFISKDSFMYPMWAKYWAFQGMLQLGSYDKVKIEFNKRSKNTISVFTDLNREVLAISIDYMIKYLDGNTNVDDEKLNILLKNGSFGKIYAYTLSTLLRNNKEISETNLGEWIKYNQGSDHMKLVKSLQGHGTGWCTAGEATAKSQLENGEFYVYYSYDNEHKPTIPRIAIRMDGSSIGEVRGVGKNQNIEPEMEEVADKKLEEFPDKEKYKKKVSDMRVLTKIYKKFKNNKELSNEDLRFLYEVDSKIEGFGYRKDPRIEEIINKRNIKKDLALLFNCSIDEIAIEPESIEDRKIVYYYGSLDLRGITSAEGLILPKKIGGNLYLSGLTSAEDLILPDKIGGGLYLCRLTSAEDLILPEQIGGVLDLSGLISAEGLILPEKIGGVLYLSSLTSAEGLILPKQIGGDLDLCGLTSAESLILPKQIGGDLDLSSLTSAEGLTLPKKIGGYLDLSGLISAEDLILPDKIGVDLDLSSLTSAEGLILPKQIGGDLDLCGLTSAESLILPKQIGGYLYLRNLTNLDGVTPPVSFDKIYLANNVVITPQNINEYLNKSKER